MKRKIRLKWWNKGEDGEDRERYNSNKMTDQSQMCWGSELTASSWGWKGMFNPFTGVWSLAHVYAHIRNTKRKKKRHMPQRQAAGFNTVASVFKPGIPQWCQPCTHQAAGATGKGIAVSEGGQRDRRGAHFSRSSWLSRSGGKEHGDCFSSCSLWSRTRHSQYARNTRRGKKTHLWWYGPVFKVIVTFEFD